MDSQMSVELQENQPVEKRLHNKSGRSSLSILEYDDDTLDYYHSKLIEHLDQKGKKIVGLIPNEPCDLMGVQDGKLTVKRKKVGWGYHLQAWKDHGREALNRVQSNKMNTDLSVSHLCGTEHCCTSGHTILETKKKNDERTHCQWVMKNILGSTGVEGLVTFLTLGGCIHQPHCGSKITEQQLLKT